jgi:hypothetical protein
MGEVERACIAAILLAFAGGVLVTFVMFVINCEITKVEVDGCEDH